MAKAIQNYLGVALVWTMVGCGEGEPGDPGAPGADGKQGEKVSPVRRGQPA